MFSIRCIPSFTESDPRESGLRLIFFELLGSKTKISFSLLAKYFSIRDLTIFQSNPPWPQPKAGRVTVLFLCLDKYSESHFKPSST